MAPPMNWFKKLFGNMVTKPPDIAKEPVIVKESDAHERPKFIREKVIEIAELGVGIDFGTSSTKIVLQDLQLKQKWAVPFAKGSTGSTKYLFPSSVILGDDGVFSLGGEGRLIQNIKLALLGMGKLSYSPDTMNPKIVVTGYLALLIRHSLSWFEENQRKYIRAEKILYFLNIGLPAKNCDDIEMMELFRQVALAAWFAAVEGGDLTEETLQQTLLRAARDLDNPSTMADGSKLNFDGNRIAIVPEIIAGIFGYANSPARRDGMYLLVDVGAATLDGAVFNLFKSDGMDRYSIFEADVQQYGVLAYVKSVKERIQQLPIADQKKHSKYLSINPLSEPIPELFDIGAGIIDPTPPFLKSCEQMITKMVYSVIIDRNPRATELEGEFPVFVTGGGRHIPYYIRLVPTVGHRLATMHFNRFEIRDLPIPDDLEAPDLMISDYHRMQISYGLSFHPLSFGDIINKGCIGDIKIETTILDFSDRFVDKDMT